MVTNSKVQAITAPLCLSDEQLRKCMTLFLAEMKKGLGKETNAAADVKMLPTYVRAIPSGQEEGKFLALDLGGTNFRVLLIDLKGRSVKMSSKIFNVPQEIMVGTGAALFDHIAECMYRFMYAEGILDQVLPLGFTFSFPCRQLGLASAKLIRWTKGFSASNVEGEDVAKLLKEAVKRRGDFDVDIVAVVNDTTGTLMSCGHSTPTAFIGLILGTGCNACYMERIENVELWDGDTNEPKEVIINMECGAFGDNGVLDFIRTEFDQHIDNESINKGNQKYEKMTSGMYLGELVRLVLLKLTEAGLLFGGKLPAVLKKKDVFYTKYLSEIEADADETVTRSHKILRDELGISYATKEDAELVRYVCSLVSSRAAILAAIAMVTIMNHMKRPMTTVGIDGSVYKYHPKVHTIMTETINRFIDPNLKFKLMLSEDGSGKGAALIAAVAAYQKAGKPALSDAKPAATAPTKK
ncbi:putative hexokinase HKDC1 [Hypsibius exemplaris]|uniref:Phosphotransferase n=1 Tax=Hypsibius exemplaris TaxID=2072580 RepID=A0A1W0XFG0_HYPEX|nr:putative hexokinase HKDC1 [Hypsibius exemplaris]